MSVTRIIIALLILPLYMQANFNPPLIITGDLEEVNAKSYVSSFGDVTCELGISDILEEWEDGSFATIRKRSNIGFTRVCYWMQFQVVNETDINRPLYIEIPNPELERVQFYVYNDTMSRVKYVETGNRFPFRQRDVKHRNFIFELEAAPSNIYTIFIRVERQANYVNVPIKIWDKSHRLSWDQQSDYKLGMFYGVMLLYVFIMAFVSYFLNDKYYLYYTLLLALGIFFIFINEGMAFQFFWPRNPWLQNVMRYFILNAYLLFSMLLVENFIRDKLQSNLALNLLRSGIVFLALLTLMIFMYPTMGFRTQFVVSILLSILIIIVHILLLGMLYLSYKRTKERGLVYFLAAFSISLGIILFFTMVKFGLLPVNIETSVPIYFGGSLVGLIFTILFGSRVREVITSNKHLRTELGLAGTKYSYALLEGQEKERKRVADELHDGIGIKMSALKMKLSALHREENSPDRDEIDEIIKDVDSSCANIRSMSHSLVPRNLERYGLQIAINDLVSELRIAGNTVIIFNQKRLQEQIESTSKLALYRLIEGVLSELVRRKVEQVTLRVIIIPSIQQASINFKYIGRRVEFGVNRNLENVRAIIQVLHGQVRWTMDTMWSNQVDIEVPVAVETNGEESRH